MNQIRYVSTLSEREVLLINQFMQKASIEPLEQIEEQPNIFPFLFLPTGRGHYYALAWLVFTFIGASGAVFLKSFLQSIGKELGKKVVDYWFKKNEETPDDQKPRVRGPLYPCAVLFKPKPDQIIVIPIKSTAEPGFEKLQELPEHLEKITFEPDEHTELIAEYNVDPCEWEFFYTQFDELKKDK